MLAYVDKLTRRPEDVSASDVSALRRAGLSDAAILDICQVAAYYAFVNRLADGLGVEVESES
jgi:alkylhydroperoxidase family enzyme